MIIRIATLLLSLFALLLTKTLSEVWHCSSSLPAPLPESWRPERVIESTERTTFVDALEALVAD